MKIPATPEGIPAIQAMTAEGRSVNITLVFSLFRYDQVIEAYLSGLETFAAAAGNPATVHSVASFFVSVSKPSVQPKRSSCEAASLSPKLDSPTNYFAASLPAIGGRNSRYLAHTRNARYGRRRRPRTPRILTRSTLIA